MDKISSKEVAHLPKFSDDGKYVHCAFCNQKFRFEFDALHHEKEKHADKM
ncbi:hypothetical protein HMPREF0322_00203 [Desulfitobacterium hafniense DP7]|uniref:C2H2-type domain-containing protein n=1 Tax=Desulfitobacterium hafniense DP7 TaxID=537010 RepID=G9XGY7_DESHA|nr:hypothetical protein HMPREF0322_00203 [Desulfitobacterium hafniense DP7]